MKCRTFGVICIYVTLLLITGCGPNIGSVPSVQVGTYASTETTPILNSPPSEETMPNETAAKDDEHAKPSDNGSVVYQPHMDISDIDFSKLGIYEIRDNTVYTVDLNGDDTLESLTITNTTHEVQAVLNGKQIPITIVGETYLTVNGIQHESLEYQGGCKGYFMRKNDGSLGLIITGKINDYDLTYIFGFDGIKPVCKEKVGLEMTSLTIESITLSGIIYVFGNWSATARGAINEDFSVTYDNDGYFALGNCETGDYLDTKIDVSVQMKSDSVFADTILPAESRIYPKYISSAEDCIIFETKDGSIGRLFISQIDGTHYIQGISEFDIFENIVYVGY